MTGAAALAAPHPRASLTLIGEGESSITDASHEDGWIGQLAKETRISPTGSGQLTNCGWADPNSKVRSRCAL